MPLEDRLPEIIARLGPDVAAAVQAGAELVVQSAKARVPVDTGRLQRAIHTEIAMGGEGVEVIAGGKDPETGDDVYWGIFVEHGTVEGQSPHPFLVPALEENREPIIQLVEAAIQEAAR